MNRCRGEARESEITTTIEGWVLGVDEIRNLIEANETKLALNAIMDECTRMCNEMLECKIFGLDEICHIYTEAEG